MVIHLYNHTSGEKPAVIFDVLKKKCKYKAIPLPTMELMAKHPKLHELESEWINMLSHQVPMLPPREQFWQELPNCLHGFMVLTVSLEVSSCLTSARTFKLLYFRFTVSFQ
jgi:hypothetical protein